MAVQVWSCYRTSFGAANRTIIRLSNLVSTASWPCLKPWSVKTKQATARRRSTRIGPGCGSKLSPSETVLGGRTSDFFVQSSGERPRFVFTTACVIALAFLVVLLAFLFRFVRYSLLSIGFVPAIRSNILWCATQIATIKQRHWFRY